MRELGSLQDSGGGESPRSLLKELTICVAAGPAALGLLGHIGDRLPMSEILLRIARNFRVFTDAMWDYLFSYINLDVSIPKNILTFSVLVMVPTIVQITLGRRTGGGLHRDLSIVSFCILFYFILGVSLYISIISCIGIILIYRIFSGDDVESGFDFSSNSVYNEILAYSFIFIGTMFSFIFRGHDDPFVYSTLVFVFVVFPTTFLLAAVGRGAMGPTYIVAVSLGILGIDWLGVNLLPSFQGWLDRVGV